MFFGLNGLDRLVWNTCPASAASNCTSGAAASCCQPGCGRCCGPWAAKEKGATAAPWKVPCGMHLVRSPRPGLAASAALVGPPQVRLGGVDDKNRQEARLLRRARIPADSMTIAGQLGPAL